MEACVMAGNVAAGLAAIIWASTLVVASERTSGAFFEDLAPQAAPDVFAAAHDPAALFEPGDTCMVCHNNLITRTGEDVSIGADWRASMMANSARDPYWQAAVRREILDHPQAREAIEDECSICHMPMTTFAARAGGGQGRIFDHLPPGRPDDEENVLATDGVSCAVCHQIQAEKFGDPASFTGGYVIDVSAAAGARSVFGPFAIDAGRRRVMQSSSGFMPAESPHIQQSELCATCHTLFTHSLAPGATDATLPEQAPYLEWQQSAYRDTQSCQSCHLPVIDDEIALSQVLGQPRAGVSRHTFLGGNFFMMRMLNRYRADLGVRATPAEMAGAITRTVAHLQESTARLSVASAQRTGQQLAVDLDIENLAGHKFPTAYPSRRAWIQFTVKDAQGRTVFESGAWTPDGRITGNANDADPGQFEPHYAQITQADQVQVYESVMGDPGGRVTTGLLTGTRYLKDNRLLPLGFDKARVTADVAIQGSAAADADFVGGRDRVRYLVDVGTATSDLTVTATLWFQPIGFRWAENLATYDAPETNRFVGYFRSMSSESALPIATTTTVLR
jgi:hypothetical protein